MKNKNGYLLVEMLIVIGILSIIAIGSLKSAEISLLSSKVVNNIQAEADLKLAIHSALSDDKCFQNLDYTNPSLLDDPIIANTKIVEELNIGAFQLRSGSDFKESFSIKKMSLEEVPTAPDQRKLQVYFKRKGLKTLSTRKNKPCTINNTEGCYSYECNVQYSGTPLDSCSAFDCYTNSDSGHLISHNTFDTAMDALENRVNSKF